MQTSPRQVVVHVDTQTLEFSRAGVPLMVFSVSTSGFGLGSEEGSQKTPVGQFRISEKIGAGAALGTVFRSRRPTLEEASEDSPEDLVLSRILWLEGLEPHNTNTHSRYIYIHGTNQESKIGTPCSHGCVRMRNADIITLFDLVEEGDPVLIKV